MTEREMDERRHWKAETFLYDYYLPDESKECLYCLTEKQAELLRGIVIPLAWRTRWWTNESEPINRDTIESFRDDLIRRLMMSCCNDAIYKYIGTVLYKSTDGGETYEPAPPEDDYRTSSTYWPKPIELGIDQTKCQAADSVVETFKSQMVESINDDMSIAAIIGAIAAVLIFFLTAGTSVVISAQIAALCAAIFVAGVSAWKALFTSDVWNDFRCLIFNNMDSDNSIDQTGLDAVFSGIDDHFTGIVAATLKGYISAAGLVGINNMMASNIGDSESDCDGCTDSCDLDNWAVKIFDGNPIGIELSRTSNSITVQATVHPDFGQYVAQVQSNGDSVCCTLESIEFVTGTGDGAFRNVCDEPRWPATALSGIGGYPTDGNTFHIRNVTDPFTVIFHFG